MSLSVCCMTNGPVGRVAAQLALLRPVAREIVVAVDERVPLETLAPLDAVATRLVRFPYADPVCRSVGWLHSLCGERWILYFDDDELAGSALLAALPSLVEERVLTHYWLPRRWLYPDPARYLAQHPWHPDYQQRLVRNEAAVLRFPGDTHRPIEVDGPGMYLDLPMYHLDTVVTTAEQRLAKIRRYDALRPGRRVARRPMDEAYYLPEVTPDAATAEVEEPDRELVASVLAAEDPPPAGPVVSVDHATREEIDALWSRRPVGEGAYRACLRLLSPERLSFGGGEVRSLDVLVENLGDERWPWGPLAHPEIRVSYHWRSGGEGIPAEALRTSFPHDVAPGEHCRLPVLVQAPERPGTYELALDLVHEHVRWFGCELTLHADVRRARRAAILAGDEAWTQRCLALIAAEAPELEPVLVGSVPADLQARFGVAADSGPHHYLGEPHPGRGADLALTALRVSRLAAAARGRATLPAALADFAELVAGAELLLVPPARPGASYRPELAGALVAHAVATPAYVVGGAAHARPAGIAGRALQRLAEAHLQPLALE